MFVGREAQARELIQIAKSCGAFNIRVIASANYDISFGNPDSDNYDVLMSIIADHTNPSVVVGQMALALGDSGIDVKTRLQAVKVGERPVHLTHGALDLIADDSVVYVVVQSEHQGDLPSLLEEHPEWAGRVQIIVLQLFYEREWDDRFPNALFTVHGAGALREGRLNAEHEGLYEFTKKDFYILNHKVVWRGQVPNRDVVSDVNALLAGNDLVVLSERVPVMKLPLFEDVADQRQQVRTLFEELKYIRPDLKLNGSKTWYEDAPAVEKCKCCLTARFDMKVTAEAKEYFKLLADVTEIFPFLQSEINS
jgi:hypothetical protein